MYVLLNWLREFVEIDMSPDELARMLTSLGLEVASVKRVGGSPKGVVVGEVLKAEKHPNADKLLLCEVSIGNGKKITVITNDLSVKDGDKIPVATSGTKLYDGTVIKPTKLRGILSEGMFLGKSSFNLEEKSSGVWKLPSYAEAGEDMTMWAGEEDFLFELELTSNRPDCLGHIGVAREISAGTGKSLKILSTTIEKPDDSVPTPNIEIQNTEDCPRYSSRIMVDVEVRESPEWLKRRLELCGIRPINNIVDITNYVLLEVGHPMHAFDLDELKENRIIVRNARNGEKILALDGREYELMDDMLVIADAERPVAIAGIIGGEETGITEKTKRILLESAYFNPVSIRQTSKKLGVSTESSYRFERGADWDATMLALDRAVELIQELAGGKVSKPVDVFPKKFEKRTVSFSPKTVSDRIGIQITEENQIEILERLGFTVEAREPDRITVRVPSFRGDVSIEEDIVEEVARIYGYDNIPLTMPAVRANEEVISPFPKTEDTASQILASVGFNEVANFSFLPDRFLKLFSIDKSKLVSVSNPMTIDQKFLRNSLIPNLVGTVEYNVRRGVKSWKIFEVGKVFEKNADGFTEKKKLAVALFGRTAEKSPYEKRTADFYDLSGVIEALLRKLGVDGVYFTRASEPDFLHPGKRAWVKSGDTTIGIAGAVHPEITEKLEIPEVFVAELDIETISKLVKPKKYKPVPETPGSQRDVSFIVPDDVEGGEILRFIKDFSELIVDVWISDVYKGKNIPEGARSITYSLFFQHQEKTLTDDEINNVFFKMIDETERKFGVEARK